MEPLLAMTAGANAGWWALALSVVAIVVSVAAVTRIAFRRYR